MLVYSFSDESGMTTPSFVNIDLTIPESMMPPPANNAAITEVSEAHVDKIVAQGGFTREEATEALRKTKGNINAAMNELFLEQDRKEAATAVPAASSGAPAQRTATLTLDDGDRLGGSSTDAGPCTETNDEYMIVDDTMTVDDDMPDYPATGKAQRIFVGSWDQAGPKCVPFPYPGYVESNSYSGQVDSLILGLGVY